MVDFNPQWLNDFTGATSLNPTFRDKPTGLDGHHVGTKSNITNHPNLDVRQLLVELGTRVEPYTDSNGNTAYRAYYDAGNSADNFIGLPSSGTGGVSGGQPVHFDNHPVSRLGEMH